RGTQTMYEKSELVRLMVQALSDLGFTTAANAVEDLTGYHLECDAVKKLVGSVTEGRWNEAMEAVEALQSQLSSELASSMDANRIRFVILQHRFGEELVRAMRRSDRLDDVAFSEIQNQLHSCVIGASKVKVRPIEESHLHKLA